MSFDTVVRGGTIDVAIADGVIAGNERFPARMTLIVNGLNINVTFDGEIKLE